MRTRLAAAGRAGVGLAGLAVLLVGLHATGDVLPTPAWDPGQLAAWVRSRDPLIGVVSLLRLVALATAWYLAAVSGLAVLAELTRAAGLVRLSRYVTTPGMRRAAHIVLGASLLTAVTVPTALADGPGRPPARLATDQQPGGERATAGGEERRLWLTEALAALTDEPGDPTRAAPGVALPEPHATPRPSGSDTRANGPPVRGAERVGRPPASDVAGTDGEHVVTRGESFWSIAVDVAAQPGGSPDDARLAAYWLRLVEANRDRLVDPSDPDLITPGQRLVVPAPPPPAADAG